MPRITSSMQYENVTMRPRQLALLKRFKEQFATISVILPNSQVVYTSAILSIHPEQDCLILDELKPEEGHKRLLETKECTIEIYYKGQGIRFSGNLLAEGTEDGIAYYKIELPKSIHLYQRRTSYRVLITLSETVPIYLRTPEQDSVTGEVVDLSFGGIGFKLPRTPWTESLQQGERLTGCRVILNTGEAIYSTIQIRFAALSNDMSNDKRHMRFGGEFIDLDRQQLKVIERYIVTLDRERLKAISRM
jgi:c-di-GMP-binding flagellar brake protein YcgR